MFFPVLMRVILRPHEERARATAMMDETWNRLSWDQVLLDHSRVKAWAEVEYEEETRGAVRWDVEYA
jgi:hypothetical protein